LPESENVAILDKHAKTMKSALKQDRTYPRANLDKHFLPLYNVTARAYLFQEISTHEIRIGGLCQYSIATILF
jgi:hypothetical protein